MAAVIPIKEYQDGRFIIMGTKNGIIKKTSLSEYKNIRKSGIQAITLREDDEIIEVKTANNNDEVFMVTKYGKCIKFALTDVRRTGRSSIGVRGINLEAGDEVVGMQLERQGKDLLIVTENGMGKRTDAKEFTIQKRGGKGVKCYKISEKTGNVVGVKAVNDNQEIMLITSEGIIIQMLVSGISTIGRVAQGVKLIKLDNEKNVDVVAIAKVRETPEQANDNLSDDVIEEDIPDNDDVDDNDENLEETEQ